MKTIFNIIFISIFCQAIVSSQSEISREKAMEDYNILKNVLTQGYPSLYEYTTKSSWDSLFTLFEKEKINSIKNNVDLYKSLSELTDYTRDGHLIVMRPQLESIPYLFPLLLKIIDEKFYTDTDDFGIPVGAEIISINGIAATDIRQKLLKYAPSDGYNTSKKDRQIEREFSIPYLYEFGYSDSFRVAYKIHNKEVAIKEIESQPFESIGRRFVNRNSYFSIYHKAANKPDFVKNTLGNKEPFLYFIDSIKTAVLTMHSFQLDPDKFRETLAGIYEKIEYGKTENLIIDIRHNEGGYPLNCIDAFSYIASRPFKQRISTSVATSSLPEMGHGQNLVNGYTYQSFFEEYYKSATKKGNEWISDSDENEAFMIPKDKRFKGKVYVLISGKTFSAGSSFALFCKNQGITLVGEEAGGGYYTQTGGYPIIYTLPNSGIKILISFVKINRYVKDTNVKKGYGIYPDIEIPLTLPGLIKGSDEPLDYVINRLDQN